MPKIHATVMLYDDRCFLSSSIESLIDHFDNIIFADGAYAKYLEDMRKYYPKAEAWSTDGSLELIKSFHGMPSYKILHPPEGQAWANQNVKRDAMINAVPNGDYFVGVDADEMIIGDVDEGLWEIINSGCYVGRMPLVNLGQDADRMYPYWHPRVFKKLNGMHYKGTHWYIRDRFDRLIEDNYPTAQTFKSAIAHFKYLKPLNRMMPHHSYMLQMLQKRAWIEPENLKTTNAKKETR